MIAVWHRGVLAGFALFFAATECGSAQTVVTATLTDFSRFLTTASKLISDAVAGLNEVDTKRVPVQDRAKAIAELRAISESIVLLRSGKAFLIDDLDNYGATVEKGGAGRDENSRMWRTVLDSVESVSAPVLQTLRLVETSDWLDVTLAAEDRIALREALLSRVNLLDRLRNLPPPSTPQELAQLRRVSTRYRDLMAKLRALNVELTQTADRIQVK